MRVVAGLALIGLLSPHLPASRPQGPVVDPAAHEGVYVDTPLGIVELTSYLEEKVAMNWSRGNSTEFVTSVGFHPPTLAGVKRFLVNTMMPRADAAMARTGLRLVVMQATDPTSRPTADMTVKALRVGVNLFELTSPELDQGWIRKASDRLSRKGKFLSPEVHLELYVHSLDGKPGRIYPVRIQP